MTIDHLVPVASAVSLGPGYSKNGPFEVSELDQVVPDLVARAITHTNAYGEPKTYNR